MRVVWWVLGLLLVLVGPLAAAEYIGKVIAVSDGDTLTILTAEKQQVKVRLGEIDTPESGQPYGARAKQALSESSRIPIDMVARCAASSSALPM